MRYNSYNNYLEDYCPSAQVNCPAYVQTVGRDHKRRSLVLLYRYKIRYNNLYIYFYSYLVAITFVQCLNKLYRYNTKLRLQKIYVKKEDNY